MRRSRSTAKVNNDHAPVNDHGWTSCVEPGRSHRGRECPDNCVHSSHAAYGAAGKLTYAEWAAARNERLASQRRAAVRQAHGTLAVYYQLSVDQVEVVLRRAQQAAQQQ